MRRADMGARKESKDAADRLCSILENLEGTPAEDLRSILLNVNPDADAKEQEFITHLRSLQTSEAGAATDETPVGEGMPLTPLKGLISEAKKRGLSVSGLADAARLSPSLVKMLDMKLARFATIPTRVVEELAAALGRGAGEVALYLQGGPALTATAYQSEGGEEPRSLEQRDFLELVRDDRNLSEERRASLLG